MLLIREVMYCKPGRVKPLAEKFVAMSQLMEKNGMGKMRVMTDLSAERYWMAVAEFEVPTLAAFESIMAGEGGNPEQMKEMDKIMKDYHELVEHGRREIFKIEN
jgi:hypothetical protein